MKKILSFFTFIGLAILAACGAKTTQPTTTAKPTTTTTTQQTTTTTSQITTQQTTTTTTTTQTTTTTVNYDQLKADVIADLNEVVLANYRAEEKAIVLGLIEEHSALINSKNTEDDILDQYDAAVAAIKAVKTNVQYLIKELGETNLITLTADTINYDAGGDAFTIWTNEGTKVREVTNVEGLTAAWNASPWRYYLVFDAEGRMTYGTIFPDSGYGSPYSTSFAAHSMYRDTTTNPSFVVFENYQPWPAAERALFEIVVPEGGFAVSAHGTGISNLLTAFLGTETVFNDNQAEYNKHDAFEDSLRVAFDSTTKSLVVYHVEEYPEVNEDLLNPLEGKKVKIGNYTASIWFDTARHWVADDEFNFMANHTWNGDGYFGYSYEARGWNKGFVADQGVGMVLDANNKIVYLAIADENIDVLVTVKDGVVTKSTLGHTDVLKNINKYLPVGGKVLFANNKGPVNGYPNLAVDTATELASWDEAAILNTEIIIDYVPEETFDWQILNGIYDSIGNYTTAFYFNCERHWVADDSYGFVAANWGNRDAIYGYSEAVKDWNQDFVATNGVALVLDKDGKLVYGAIVTGEIDVVIKVEDGTVSKSQLGHTNVMKDVNDYVPVGGCVLFASDLGGGSDDYLPNIALDLFTEFSTWSEEAFLTTQIFDQYQ